MASIKPELLTLQNNEQDNRIKWSTKSQYNAAICMCLLAFCYGSTCGWTSGAFIILTSNDTPLISGPLTSSEIGWIASGIGIGGFIGNFIFGWLSEKLGRKITLYIVVIPQILSWLFIYYARTSIYLIISRILGGLSGGGVFAILPNFISEIADNHVRGILGSFMVLFCNTGILYAYICGGYFDYDTVPFLVIPFSIVFIFMFAKYPDSPLSLVTRKHFQEAEESILFYRSIKAYSNEAKEYLDDNTNTSQLRDVGAKTKLSINDFKSKAARRAIFYGIALMGINQFCGCFAMITYTALIFQKSGSDLSPINSSIIVAVIQIIGSFFATVLVEKLGRKTMLSISAIGTSLGHCVLGSYLLLHSRGYDLSDFNFIPVISFSFLIFLGNVGILTLPFLLISEFSPSKIRGFTSTLCMSFCWTFVFIAIKYLPTLIDLLEMHGAIFLFSFNSFIGALFILFFIPETKGKSFEEIQRIMER